MKPGRSPKLVPERMAKLVDYIKWGVTDKVACIAVGIEPTTLYRWLQEGSQSTSGIKRELNDAVTRARAEAEAAAMGVIRKAMPTDWKAAAWYLEHGASRHNWHKVEKLEHSGPDGGPIRLSKEKIVFTLKFDHPHDDELEPYPPSTNGYNRSPLEIDEYRHLNGGDVH